MPEQLEHQGVWWHRKDDGSIHRHDGTDWVRWSPGDPGTPPPTWLGAPALVAPQRNTEQIGRVITGFLLLGAIIWLFVWCGSVLEDTPEVPFSGTVTDFNVQDEANIFVQFDVTNEGDTAAKGECTIRAEDASGTVGFDIFSSREPIQPGETVGLAGSIRIEDEGAFRVRRVVARNCGSA